MYNGVSILLPVYAGDNLEHLKHSLQSIRLLQQDQLVIVFDGSGCEEHWSIVKLFLADAKYEYTFGSSIQQRGLGNNLNFGLELCSKNMVGRFDADDIFLPNRSTLIKDLDLKTADIFAFSVAEFMTMPDCISSYRVVPTGMLDLSDLSMRNILNHMAVYYHKDKIMKIGGYRNIPGFEDYDLWLRSLKAGYKIKGMSELITHARVGNDFLSRRTGFKYVRHEWAFFKRCIKEGLLPINVSHVWLARMILRLLPKIVVSLIYRRLRK